MAAITICSDFGAQKHKVWHCFPIYLPWSDGNWMPWSLFFERWVLSQTFHSPLSFSSRGSLFPLLSAIRVVSSAYLRLLIFLLTVLIPACASSSRAFHMMYFAYTLNKQCDNIQPWHTPFSILNESVVPCLIQPVCGHCWLSKFAGILSATL